ncbi:MAG TPA: mannose-1-phosphate guanylyltransferase/mannose-6-phosphate isomerase [Usitatibacter sp.]|nr:mannose-1-phosphate guanylyltransferase/mannose-6-phosphate isomerase [Usitatibacter sp.]
MLIPIILSGGAGSRLWPVSREASPKPFMKVGDGQSLLRRTFDRASALAGVAEVVTVTNRDYLFKTRDEYGEGGKPCTFVLEPFGRNTAPALAMAALLVEQKHGAAAAMLMLPADHLIQNQEAFARDVTIAEELACQGMLVTFGIQPDRADTGFGYMELGQPIDSGGAFRAKRFVEKPSLDVAQGYLDAGNYVWNSGMFCFTAGDVLEAFARHQPQLLEAARACWGSSSNRAEQGSRIVEIDAASFGELADISIDYAIMEKAANVAIVRAGFDWSDIGSWSAIHQALGGDAKGNSVVGEAVLVDVSNTYIQADGRLVAAVGLDNVVIVDTPDALLVADRDRSQDVKKVVEQLKLSRHESVKVHRTVARPWGTYTVLEEGDGFKIKRIVVKPGQSLSLQMHHHRSEHWVVVSGTARVTNGERELLVHKNESTYILAGNRHRLENPGMLDLVMIEVQSGDYLGEDDIVRFDDKYGRV